jgi:hypothetical protein
MSATKLHTHTKTTGKIIVLYMYLDLNSILLGQNAVQGQHAFQSLQIQVRPEHILVVIMYFPHRAFRDFLSYSRQMIVVR